LKKRYIYIFTGQSNIGKSFIANSIKLNILEADIYDKLPDLIEDDIVILGNKKYDIHQDIIPRFIGLCYFILVEFSISYITFISENSSLFLG
jgi:hypothetical protein